MKLTQVAVRNFRSYAVGTGGQPSVLDVSDGLNLLIGPNNCGKSNLLRAVALALEDTGGAQFDPEADRPQQKLWAYPTITLSFRCDASKSVEKTLLKYVDAYEKSAGATNTFASRKTINLRVVYRTSGREETFSVAGHPNKKGDSEKLARALSQFKKSIRFIYIKSGDSLSNFLAGAFNELLQTVLREHLSAEMETAAKKREEYIQGLSKELLDPLGMHAQEQLKEILREVRGVKITPFVPVLAETLSRADIVVRDEAETSILNKGTGVRGALLVALLGYLAKNTRRSLILAVEEPECFLHPAAQHEMRADLLQLADRGDVTLLVTTHSPFMIERSDATAITPFAKDDEGVTRIGTPVKGSDKTAAAVSSLFDEAMTPSVLEMVEPMKPSAKAILYLEGYTDLVYLRTAAKVTGRAELLNDIELRFDEGAFKAAIQALLMRQMVGPDLPIAVVLDWDVPGKEARRLMTERFNWKKKDVLTYRQWRDLNPSETPVEAEDMFDGSIVSDFVVARGDAVLAEKVGYQDGTFHYGLTQLGKQEFLTYVGRAFKKEHAGRWVKLLEDVRGNLGL